MPRSHLRREVSTRRADFSKRGKKTKRGYADAGSSCVSPRRVPQRGWGGNSRVDGGHRRSPGTNGDVLGFREFIERPEPDRQWVLPRPLGTGGLCRPGRGQSKSPIGR